LKQNYPESWNLYVARNNLKRELDASENGFVDVLKKLNLELALVEMYQQVWPSIKAEGTSEQEQNRLKAIIKARFVMIDRKFSGPLVDATWLPERSDSTDVGAFIGMINELFPRRS